MIDNRNPSRFSMPLVGLLFVASIACLNSVLLAEESIEFEKHVRPMLEQNCYGCHSKEEQNGNIALDALQGDERQSQALWHKVLHQLRSKSMPPWGEAGPTDEQRTLAMSWIKSDVFRHDPKHPDPGVVTVRRLNRIEYRNTIRDLMGVEYDTNSNFPSDDTGYGFDNIADVLTISPLLLEKYISAAKVIVTKSVPAVSGVAPRRTLPGGLFTKEVLNDGPKNSDVAATPKEEPAGNRFGRPMQGPPKDEPLTLTMSYKEHSIGKMTTNVTTGGKYTVEVNLKAAELLRQFATKAYRRPVDEETVERLAMLAESVYGSGKETFESGVAQSMTAVLASPRFLFREEGFIQDVDGSHPWLDDYAIASRLSYFLWSTMPDQELMQLAAQGDLRANLDKQVNRMINDPRCSAFFQNFVGQWLQSREVEAVSIDSGAVTRRESDVRPASSSDVDRERRNTLRNKPLAELTDAEKSELEKLQNFRQGFGGRNRGPNFDDKVKRSMRAETEMLFQHILTNDLPLTELIDCDYTFLNEDLAKFYEIPKQEPIKGNEMRRVMLPEGSLRGGILTQGTFLTVTSNPNRTSPVKRGLFILENVLGSPVAAPPPNIPSLEDAAVKKDGKKQSLRETLAIHRENAVCSSCHNKMDPLGLAFENFNALGRYREKEFGEAVDTVGTLSSGEPFGNVTDLKKALVKNHKQEIYYCMAEKMMTYALGRGLDFRDNYALDDIVQRIEQSDGKARALLDGVVHSTQFLKRRNAEGVAVKPTSK